MFPSPGTTEEPPLPTLDFYGKDQSVRSQPRDAEPLPPDSPRAQLEEPEADGRGSGIDQPRGGASGKRKSGDMDAGAGGGCGLDSKRPCTPLAWELAQEERELFCRRQQEESDRQLALRLQRQLDREEAQSAVDRSKGSRDGYLLRDKPDPAPGPAPDTASDGSWGTRAAKGRPSPAPVPKEQKNRPKRQPSGASKERPTPRRDPSASASASSPAPCGASPAHSPASALKKGSKQTTLTEMFPSLAS